LAEVPLSAINLEGSTFVALWSPTEYFVSTASSPILAGGWGSNKTNSWLNNDIKGYPPLDPRLALKTAISAFEPAIAIKLIAAGSQQDIFVKIQNIYDGRAKTPNKTFTASVMGEEIEKAWLEVSPVKSGMSIDNNISNNDKQYKQNLNEKTKGSSPASNGVSGQDGNWKNTALMFIQPRFFSH